MRRGAGRGEGGARTLIRGGELSRGWVRESGLGEILRGLGAMARANARARALALARVYVCMLCVCVCMRVSAYITYGGCVARTRARKFSACV